MNKTATKHDRVAFPTEIKYEFEVNNICRKRNKMAEEVYHMTYITCNYFFCFKWYSETALVAK